jgi:circadian clock protein KaiC
VEVLWQPTTEGILDEACHRLLNAVRRRGVQRLFIDGLEDFERLTTDRERLGTSLPRSAMNSALSE